MRGFRKLLVWTLRGVVFVLLLGLALKNREMVDLYFFFGQHWEIPVSLVVLGSFGIGAVLGLTATFSRSMTRHLEEKRL